MEAARARCRICDHPVATRGETDRVCGRCLLAPPAFERARACVLFRASDDDDPLRAALHRYKYGRETALANGLGSLFATRGREAVRPHDVVVPVPLHLERLRWRGFNQALLLAGRLCRTTGVRLDSFSLVRRRATVPQVELDEGARRRNVAGAFCVARPERVAGRRVLLVDDVLTTGSTVNECSRALQRAGAAAVDVLVLARALRD
jgi:ComF family protein